MKLIRPTTITDSILTSSSVAEADAATWSSGTTYALDATVIKSHRIWRSLQAANTNHDPATSPTWWLDTGPTNRWAMFDSVVGTETTATSSITVTLTPGRCDALALLEVTAANVHVAMVVGAETVYDRTVDLLDNSVVTDWYSYFFEPEVRANYLVITDLPVFGEGVITITITGSGTVACGLCVVGLQSSLGSLLRSPSVGINDYSRKSADDFGNTILVKRSYSKRLGARLVLDNNDVDRVVRVLAGLRATPVVWIGSEYFDALVVYGFYKDFDVDIAYPNVSYCSLTIEGMI